MAVGCLIALFQILLLFIFENPFQSLFTDQTEVINQLALAWPVLLVFTFFDTTQAVGGAVVRACGKQGIGAFVTSFSYWAIGIPLSYYSCFKLEFGIRGLWFGPTAAVTLMTFLYNTIIGCIDWPDLLDEMDRRKQKENAIAASLAANRKFTTD